MAVNPNLATLMRVIEDYQDKMPEGEYLQAMNALGALHRTVAPAIVPIVPVVQAAVIPAVRQLQASDIFSRNVTLLGTNGYEAWTRVCRVIPGLAQLLPEEWVAMSQEEQNELNRVAARQIAEKHERIYRNPVPSTCPFISRHAFGSWSTCETATWACVCGYSGKTKHWKKHEKSARHQDWAQHRTVPSKIVKIMRQQIQKDERGSLIQFIRPLSGGFRYYPVCQERNEWTNPELYPGTLRLSEGQGWFVYPSDACEIMEE